MKQLRINLALITAFVFLFLNYAWAQNPPIPDLALWESHMIQFGAQHCNQTAINKALLGRNTDEGNVWYYDGTRIYQEIEEYTANPDWYRCAGYVASAYETFAIGNRVDGWRVFPHGLASNYLRTADMRARQGVHDLATLSAFATTSTDPAWSDSWEFSREIAYIEQAYILDSELTGTPHPITQVLEKILGHFDQWFGAQTAPIVKPFMVALSSEALIFYYEHFAQDPRIPIALQQAADWLWSNAWAPSSRAFQYGVCRSGGKYSKGCNQGPSADLNLLIAPLFGWLYKETLDPKYQIEGDQIFTGGVELAWLGGGKQFSQNYRWSFDYVKWRR